MDTHKRSELYDPIEKEKIELEKQEERKRKIYLDMLHYETNLCLYNVDTVNELVRWTGTPKPKEKISYITHIIKGDTRTITVVAKIKDFIGNKWRTRNVSFGYAIQNPIDTFKEEIGEKIAKNRAEKGSYGNVSTRDSIILLNKDIIKYLMDKLGNDILNNPHKYIAGYKEN